MYPTRDDLNEAFRNYWLTKDQQLKKAEAAGSKAEGTAKAVRSAGQFISLAALLARFFVEAGFPPESIGTTRSKTILPGYYRASKNWDLVVVHKGVLVAAIEMKALGGPSFGNNYNNRLEEALGNSADLGHAHLTGLAGAEKPWLGYFFVMQDEEGSRKPVRLTKGPLSLDPVWKGLSYQQRFALTGERLLDEKHYDAVGYFVSSKDDPLPKEPSRRLDWDHFSAEIVARLTYLRGLGYP